MKQFTFTHNNVEVIVQLEEITVKQTHNQFSDYISEIKYKTLVKNTIETIEPKYEGDLEASLVYWALGYATLITEEPDPNLYVNIKDINYEIFCPFIESQILSNEKQVQSIERYGSILGLCDAPKINVNEQFKRQTISNLAESEIQYTEIGLAKLTIN
jgi:hypothetical protein